MKLILYAPILLFGVGCVIGHMFDAPLLCGALFAGIPVAVILQLLAYYVADFRGCSIDKPRNLAKSVTVE